MGRKCVVPLCRSGYDSCPEKVSMFSVPKNRIEDWQKAIGRTDLKLTTRHTVCEKHFRKKDVIREIKTETYTYPLLTPKLSENAIPRIFPKTYEFRPRGKRRPSSITSLAHFIKKNSAAMRNMKSSIQEPEVPSRLEFMENLEENRRNLKKNCTLTKEVYNDIVSDLIENIRKVQSYDTNQSQMMLKKKTKHRKKMKKIYDVVKVDGIKKLVFPSKKGNDFQMYVHDEELFDILQDTHVYLKHGGPHKMMAELKKTYKNICFKDVITYTNLCPSCRFKKISRRKKILKEEGGEGKKYCTELSSSCHVTVMDYQSNPDNEFKFILIYQNDLTKYHLLRPLKSRTVEDICTELCDIFAFLGVPATIYSRIDNDLMQNVIKKIKFWPELQIIHVKCEADVDINCTEIVNEHLEEWMEHNNTKKWSEGLRFVQLIINQDYHKDISKAPYDVLFKLSTDDTEESGERIPTFGENTIKEENVEIFSCVCEGCGNDIGNQQVCSLCQMSSTGPHKSEIN